MADDIALTNEIVLTNKILLAKGNDRWVYQHPDDDNLIIKVVIADIPKYHSKLREMKREIHVCSAVRNEDRSYIQTIKGYVKTNLGLGEIVVKEKDSNGDIAPTLYDLAEQGELDKEKLGKLHLFLAWFIRTDVVINSLHCKNIVYSFRDEQYQFKIIDGFGDKTFFQLSHFSSYIHARNKIKCLTRLFDQLTMLTSC
ncbi:PhoP regulatory network YrbL family protein [Pectobacterium cacticida]|uniref:PhoP regulatory network YrbL family protein n=1 Tax=Pectobacterium cacticida TaxID=69221 RepID=A0ABZ2GBK1_9GAMM|nr:PhoP regulatory network YrbL family protein [Pectobacterium cacticida]UYX07186.1 PhoP regulatory network YrbL family protein [Pectobacterium cacticida]